MIDKTKFISIVYSVVFIYLLLLLNIIPFSYKYIARFLISSIFTPHSEIFYTGTRYMSNLSEESDLIDIINIVNSSVG